MSRGRRSRSPSTRNCGTASAAPSEASSRRPLRPRTRVLLAEFTANNAIALQQLAKDPAIQIRKLDDTILQALGKISGEVLAETSRKDDLARRVYDSFIKFRAAAVRWGDISERAFLNARALPYPFGG